MSRFLKNLSKFKLITFDVTDTLLKFKHDPATQYIKTAGLFGYSSLEKSKISQNFRTNFKRMNSSYPNFGRDANMEWSEWWRLLVVNIFQTAYPQIPENDLNRIAAKLIVQFETEECWTRISGSSAIVESVRAANKRVGIISNFDPRLAKIVQNLDLPKFDFIVNSYDAGCQKPHPKIFERALYECGGLCRNDEALHIGNTPLLDYIGARRAGWSSILISNGTEDWKQYSDIEGRFVFESIDDLIMGLETSQVF